MSKETYCLHQRIETLERVIKALLISNCSLNEIQAFQYLQGIEENRIEAAYRHTEADSP